MARRHFARILATVQRAVAFASLVLVGCGAKSAIDVPSPPHEVEIDAGHVIDIDGGIDAGPLRVDAGPPPAPRCVGRIAWDDIRVCARWEPIEIVGCGGWRYPLELEASCPGIYTVCARLESQQGCVIGETCTSETITTGGHVQLRIRNPRNDDPTCAQGAANAYGARVCMRVMWDAEGHGERELGCFAENGPWREPPPRRDGATPPDPGDAGSAPDPSDAGRPFIGDDGEWTF